MLSSDCRRQEIVDQNNVLFPVHADISGASWLGKFGKTIAKGNNGVAARRPPTSVIQPAISQNQFPFIKERPYAQGCCRLHSKGVNWVIKT
jgi:hypothetical protein